MPVFSCPNGKFKIGHNGQCKFNSKEAAENAFKHWVKTQHGAWESGQEMVVFLEGQMKINAIVLSAEYGRDLKDLKNLEAVFEVYDQKSEYEDA